jgi:hypothetical protein
MQHVVAMQLQPAADERRPDRSLHRLISLRYHCTRSIDFAGLELWTK